MCFLKYIFLCACFLEGNRTNGTCIIVICIIYVWNNSIISNIIGMAIYNKIPEEHSYKNNNQITHLAPEFHVKDLLVNLLDTPIVSKLFLCY